VLKTYSLLGGGYNWRNLMWDSFISGFCKVEFLCYTGEPNWLGWLVVIGAIIVGWWGFRRRKSPWSE
tara:strand:+ start:816 stop:1016 length:201 start_codon:yes stop_codon:yes gene_type:complete